MFLQTRMQSVYNTSIWKTDSTDDLVLDETTFPNIKNNDFVRLSLQEPGQLLYLQAKISLTRIGQVQLGAEAANILNISQRVDGIITKCDKPPTATYIEFTIKDQYFSNGDFHKFIQIFHKRVLFIGKTLYFGLLKAQVHKIVIDDQEVLSGYFATSSKTVFRSKSAQIFLFLHVSRELFDFAHDGDTFYEKMVSGVVPKIFKRWIDEKANHRLTVVLFGRVILSKDFSDSVKFSSSLLSFSSKHSDTDLLGRPYKDFYQILINNSKTIEYPQLLQDIRHSVLNFRQYIIDSDETLGAFQLAFAKQGNIIEAVNLAMNCHENMIGGRELYLSSTGFSIIVVSSQNGILCCDKLMLRLLNERMLEYGTGLDIIALSPPPLSTAPVFAFLPFINNPINSSHPDPLYSDDFSDASWCYFIPEWLDQSYYTGCTFQKSKFAQSIVPREQWHNLKLKHYHKIHKIMDISLNKPIDIWTTQQPQLSFSPESHSKEAVPWQIKFEPSSSYQSNTSLSDASPLLNHLESAAPIDIQHSKHLSSTSSYHSPKPKNMSPSPSQKRWQHLLVKPQKYTVAEMKWASILAPALLPVSVQNEPKLDDYLEYNYSISNNSDVSLVELLDNMLYIRLSEGFQLVFEQEENQVVVEQTIPQRPVVEYYNSKNDQTFFKSRLNPSMYQKKLELKPLIKTHVDKVTLTRSGEVHKISIDYTSHSIQVTRFIKQNNYNNQPIHYKFNVLGFGNSSLNFFYPSFEKYHWNNLDLLISGWKEDDSLKSLSFYRTRYILIPGEQAPTNLALINPNNDCLDEEELKIAGFSKFLENFVKVQVNKPIVHKKLQDSVNSLNISMTTLTAATHVKSELQKPNEFDFTKDVEVEISSKSITLEAIVKLMTGEHGLNFKDRRWHLRSYEKVFIGSDFVDFLVKTFNDIQTREEAVTFGNKLFQQGLFEHVKGIHTLLDGHYFYRLCQPHNDSKSFGWFNKSKSTSSTNISATSDRKFKISEKMMINASRQDANKQLCVLHFDTIHNPNICFHFQIHWLLSSSYYVESLIHSWSRMATACGFKLVETPTEQSILLGENNPFREPYTVSFDFELFNSKITNKFTSFFFFGEIAAALNYILDVECDQLFPEQYKLSFSHNKTTTEYSQYIHRTGACFLLFNQDQNEIKWMENPLYDGNDLYGKPLEKDYSKDCLQKLKDFCSNKEELATFFDACISKSVTVVDSDQ